MEEFVQTPFCDPNAYIQNCCKYNQPKKVVFQEPYDCLPNFYINNNFKKGDCDCIPKQKPKPCPCGFDFKKLMPLLTGLLGKNNNMSGIVNLLGNMQNGNMDFSKIITNLLNDKNSLTNLFNLFNKTNKAEKKEANTTDFPIKNYTKVED